MEAIASRLSFWNRDLGEPVANSIIHFYFFLTIRLHVLYIWLDWVKYGNGALSCAKGTKRTVLIRPVLGGRTKRFYGGTGRGECGCVDGGVDDSDLLSRNRRCATNEGAGLASVAAGWRVKGLST